MGFDLDGARKVGYSDTEIANYLGQSSKFDVQGARGAGYSDTEILGHLTKPEPGDIGRGWMAAWRQLPQLGYGLAAMGAATVESAVGEGGLATAAKNWSVKGFEDWGEKIQQDAKETDDLDVAWGRAKEGDF